jgi:hypothetical protein
MRQAWWMPWRSAVIAAALVVGLACGGVVSAAEFTQAELFVELNDTDGDLGLHAAIDGGPYVALAIEGPGERLLLKLTARGAFARQGVTQLSLESAEPPFDELPPEKFFQRFPEGVYEIQGTTSKGREFETTVTLSHVLAAPASNVRVSGVPVAENCDAAGLPSIPLGSPVVVSWDPVTTSHPTIGKSGAVTIARYQFFVEQEALKFSVDLPPTVTAFQVPPAIVAGGGTFKLEIIARTATGNNTAIENCFVVE